MRLPRSLTRHPVILYLAVSFLAFHRCLVGGQAYIADDLLNWFGPMRFHLKNRLMNGDFPLWNPYLYNGQPFLADPQTMVLYPMNYLTIFFPTGFGLSLFFFLHMALAGWGMHRWLKKLNLRDDASYVGGLVFCLSTFFWWEMIHPPVLAAFAWMPWLFEALEGLSQRPTRSQAFWAGLVWAQLFLAGAIQVTMGAFYGGMAYFLFRLFSRLGPAIWNQGWKPYLGRNLRPIVVFTLLFCSGSVLLLGQFIPMLEFSRYSNLHTPDLTYDNFNANYSIQPGTIWQLFFPTYSVPKDQTLETAIQTVRKGGDNDFLATFGYMGIWAPYLMFVALRRKDRLSWFLAGMALLTLLLTFGKYFPLHRLICAIAPGFSLIRVTFRFIHLYVLAGSALLALGFQAQWQPSTAGKPWIRMMPWLYSAVLLLVAWTKPAATGREIAGLALGALGLIGLSRFPGRLKVGRLLFASGVILPLLGMGWGTYSLAPAGNLDFTRRVPGQVLRLADEIKPHRLFIANNFRYPIEGRNGPRTEFYPLNMSTALSYRTIQGYDPIRLKSVNDLESLPFSLLLYLSATRSLLSAGDTGDTPGFKRRRSDDLFVYEIQPPAQYITAPTDIRVIPDAKMRLAALKAPGFPVYRTVLLNEPLPADVMSRITGKDTSVEYRLVADELDRQVFDTRSSEPALLVFSEVQFPGWKAVMDGEPASIRVANHAFRSVFLPAGEHHIEFKFEPVWYPLLFVTIGLWFLTAAGFVVLGGKRSNVPRRRGLRLPGASRQYREGHTKRRPARR